MPAPEIETCCVDCGTEMEDADQILICTDCGADPLCESCFQRWHLHD